MEKGSAHRSDRKADMHMVEKNNRGWEMKRVSHGVGKDAPWLLTSLVTSTIHHRISPIGGDKQATTEHSSRGVKQCGCRTCGIGLGGISVITIKDRQYKELVLTNIIRAIYD